MQYNKTWIEHLLVHQTAVKWFRKKLLDKEQFGNIISQAPTSYKATNPFARIGFALFTLIISSSALGLFGLFLMSLF